MTGIERLRALARRMDELGVWPGGAKLLDIAGQIEREQDEERSRWDDDLCDAQMDKTCVTAVYLEMNRHVLCHEGMEDSPVARWARELREALGGDVRDHAADVSVSAYDLLPQEDREAIAWVREHGGRVNHPAPKVLDADGVEIRVWDTVYETETGERYFVTNVFDGMTEPDFPEHTIECRKYEDVVTHMFRPSQLTHTKPEPPKRCRDCAHWQKDPTADKMGVCWFFYHEREGQDCYPARLGDIGACEEFMPRARALAGVSE